MKFVSVLSVVIVTVLVGAGRKDAELTAPENDALVPPSKIISNTIVFMSLLVTAFSVLIDAS
jgi:hypothetical protein